MRLRNIPGAKDAILENRYVVQEPKTQKGKWNQCFLKEQPVHIEVGMGKGRFLMDMARLHPDINYVGIEMYECRQHISENIPIYRWQKSY